MHLAEIGDQGLGKVFGLCAIRRLISTSVHLHCRIPIEAPTMESLQPVSSSQIHEDSRMETPESSECPRIFIQSAALHHPCKALKRNPGMKQQFFCKEFCSCRIAPVDRFSRNGMLVAAVGHESPLQAGESEMARHQRFQAL